MKIEGARVPPPTSLPGLITTPMSWLYRLGINHRNRAFDAGKGVTTLDRPVISIGNLSTGGTGKTPMVHLIVRLLTESGRHPVIAMRGYGAKPGEKGDEQREHELALPGVPIIAQPDRAAGLRELFATQQGAGIDCVVLDDGFQHRKIARDLDIVLVDATRPPHRDALLPKGHLREPIGSLSRAGLVVLTHCERLDEASIERLRSAMSSQIARSIPVLASRHVWTRCLVHVRQADAWQTSLLPLEMLHGRAIHLVSGIGNTTAFEHMAQAQGISVNGRIQLRDHQAMSQPQLDDLCRAMGAQGQPDILMTRKDWVKAGQGLSWPQGATVLVPELTVEIVDPLGELHANLDAVFSA